MSFLNRVIRRRQDDVDLEQKHGIHSNTPKTFWSRSDIERLEEERVPWLKAKRAEARRLEREKRR